MEANKSQLSAERSRPPVLQLIPGESYLTRLAEDIELLRETLNGLEVPGQERGDERITQAVVSLIQEREAELDRALGSLTNPAA